MVFHCLEYFCRVTKLIILNSRCDQWTSWKHCNSANDTLQSSTLLIFDMEAILCRWVLINHIRCPPSFVMSTHCSSNVMFSFAWSIIVQYIGNKYIVWKLSRILLCWRAWWLCFLYQMDPDISCVFGPQKCRHAACSVRFGLFTVEGHQLSVGGRSPSLIFWRAF